MTKKRKHKRISVLQYGKCGVTSVGSGVDLRRRRALNGKLKVATGFIFRTTREQITFIHNFLGTLSDSGTGCVIMG